MQLTPENYKVSRLLKDIEEGVIALPSSSATSCGSRHYVADIFGPCCVSGRQGPSCYSKSKTNPTSPSRRLRAHPPLAKSNGSSSWTASSRSTAIYQALRDRSAETYFVKIGEIADAEEFDDDHLEYAKKTRFVQTVQNLKEQASAGLVPVPTLWNAAEWQQWLRELPEEEQDRMVKVRESLLPGAGEFEIPSVRLPHDADLPAIAKIFETLNRRGVRLATFDLMVARLYPSKFFFLKNEWENIRAEHSEFERAGLDDGIEVLKVIALRGTHEAARCRDQANNQGDTRKRCPQPGARDRDCAVV